MKNLPNKYMIVKSIENNNVTLLYNHSVSVNVLYKNTSNEHLYLVTKIIPEFNEDPETIVLQFQTLNHIKVGDIFTQESV